MPNPKIIFFALFLLFLFLLAKEYYIGNWHLKNGTYANIAE